MERTMIAVRLPADIEHRLAHLARETGRTKTFYVRAAVQAHIDALEDLYLSEFEAVKTKKRKTRPWRDLLNDPKAPEDFLSERPPVFDETRFLKGIE